MESDDESTVFVLVVAAIVVKWVFSVLWDTEGVTAQWGSTEGRGWQAVSEGSSFHHNLHDKRIICSTSEILWAFARLYITAPILNLWQVQ